MKNIFLGLVLALALFGVTSAATIQELILSGDLAAVKAMIESDSGLLSARGADGLTPLHTAAYNGKLEIAEYLISKGADVNIRSVSASTPMHGAALRGHAEVVRLLIAKGADVNIANASGFVPVINASIGGNVGIVRMLIDAGANVRAKTVGGLSALMHAASNGHIEVARMLLAAGATLDDVDQSGSTMIHYAALMGDTALIRMCLQGGLPLDAPDSSGQTPLLYAASRANLEAVKMLLTMGANVNAADTLGENSLHKAVFSGFAATRPAGFLDVIRLLIEKGIEVDHKNTGGYAPLVFAINLADTNVTNLMIDAGADFNNFGGRAIPPLITAISQSPSEFVSYWLNRGARTDVREPNSGATALHAAVLRGNLPIVQELLAKDTSVNETDNDGRTPLDLARRYDHKQIVQALKAKGAKTASKETGNVSASLLRKPLTDNQASVWYLLNCGYAVKTKNHFLIFDYIPGTTDITESSLSNGHINPAELAGENVFVFTTHEHGDHYQSGIWDWIGSLPKLTYVFGFRPELLPESARQGYRGQPYEFIGPRSNRPIADMQVRTIKANDAGVGFVINVDGLTIYHAGDHAGWLPNQRAGYTSEIDSIAAAVGTVDIAFVNVTGCHVQDTLALAEGTRYTLDKLSPKLVVPTHAQGNEYYYEQFARKLRPGHPDVLFFCPQHRGDAVRFSKNGVKGKIEAI